MAQSVYQGQLLQYKEGGKEFKLLYIPSEGILIGKPSDNEVLKVSLGGYIDRLHSGYTALFGGRAAGRWASEKRMRGVKVEDQVAVSQDIVDWARAYQLASTRPLDLDNLFSGATLDDLCRGTTLDDYFFRRS